MFNFINHLSSNLPPYVFHLLQSLVVILGVLLIRKIILKAIYRRYDVTYIRYIWAKITAYLSFFVILMVLWGIWFKEIRSLSTIVGLASAGVAIALKEPLVNMAAWFFILLRRPLVVGDRVQIGKLKGDVVDIRLFTIALAEVGEWVKGEQSTGRLVYLPNGSIFSQPLTNYTKDFPFIWNEISVLITFESNWRKAKERFQEVLNQTCNEIVQEAEKHFQKAKERLFIHYSTLTPIVYTHVEDSGVLLVLRHICPVRKRRSMTSHIWENILEIVEREEDIDLAYPTIRYYTPPGKTS